MLGDMAGQHGRRDTAISKSLALRASPAGKIRTRVDLNQGAA
jgi:hypothetical protein